MEATYKEMLISRRSWSCCHLPAMTMKITRMTLKARIVIKPTIAGVLFRHLLGQFKKSNLVYNIRAW